MARNGFDVAGDYVSVKDFEGELVLFTPTQYVEEMTTTFGTKDAVMADLVVLSQEDHPEHEDVLIFQGSLIASLKRRLKVSKTIERDPSTGVVSEYEQISTRRVLGVIAKGEAKKGQNAPYILETATDAQVAVAAEWHDKNPVPEFPKVLVNQRIETGAAPFVAPASVQAPAPVFTPAAAQPASYDDAEDPFAV